MVGAVPLIIHVSSEDASAAPDTHTWDGGGADAYAGTHANWVGDVAPIDGDSVVIDAGALPVWWNLSITLVAFSINLGYSGVVSQNVSFTVGAFTIGAGTFTSDATNWITITTAWTKTAGTVDNWGCYQFAGTTSLTANSAPFMGKIWVSAGTLTVASSVYVQTSVRIDNGCTISVSSGKSINDYGAASSVFNGVVTGAGYYAFSHASVKGSYIFPSMASSTWAITNIQIATDGVGTTKTITLSSAWATSSSLVMYGATVATTTLLLGAYPLSCNGLTLSVRTVLNGDSSVITDSGNWDSSAGTFNGNTSTLIMTGAGKTIKTANTNGAPYDLQISGTVSTLSSLNVSHNLTVDNTKTLTISSENTLTYNASGGGIYSNPGTIAGPGTMVYSYDTADSSISLGTVNAPVQVKASSIATTNRVSTLTSTTVLGGNLQVSSDSPSYSMTLDSGGFSTSAVNITVGSGGILNEGSGHFICSDYWDSSNGTVNYGTSTVYATGNGKYLKLNSSGQLNNLVVNGTSTRLISSSGRLAGNLTVASTGSVSLQNDSYLMNSLVNSGSITQNGKRLNISGSSATPLTGYGTFDGELALNGSTASSYQVQTGMPMGYLFTDRNTKINLDANRYLQVVPQTSEFVNVSIKTYGTEGYVARWSATSTGPVSYSLIGSPGQLYDIWVDHATRVAVVQASVNGLVQFTYNGPYSAHEFTVSVSGGISSTLEASFEYTIFGNEVTFTDKSLGAISEYLWNFGDGKGSTSQSPTHRYAKAGTYTITLIVYDSSGKSSTAKTDITLVLGPDFPIEPNNFGWNIFVSEAFTLSISAIGLLFFGIWFFISSYFNFLMPILTPRFRKGLGVVLMVIGIFWVVFVDNSHSWLGWGSA